MFVLETFLISFNKIILAFNNPEDNRFASSEFLIFLSISSLNSMAL